MENNTVIKSFLNELIHNININNITEEQLKHIGDFLMEYKFSEYKNHNDKDILKYLFLGYHIYNNIKKNTID